MVCACEFQWFLKDKNLSWRDQLLLGVCRSLSYRGGASSVTDEYEARYHRPMLLSVVLGGLFSYLQRQTLLYSDNRRRQQRRSESDSLCRRRRGGGRRDQRGEVRGAGDGERAKEVEIGRRRREVVRLAWNRRASGRLLRCCGLEGRRFVLIALPHLIVRSECSDRKRCEVLERGPFQLCCKIPVRFEKCSFLFSLFFKSASLRSELHPQ